MVLHLVYSSVPLPSLIWITIKTIIEHITNQTKRDAAYDATKELVYAIGLAITKRFGVESGRNTVERLQGISAIQSPNPTGIHTEMVTIPTYPSCAKAADILTEAFGGAEQTREVAGGVHWWRVRSSPGFEAEWIVDEKDLERERMGNFEDGKGLPIMIYMHGGSGYWGSPNTHRPALTRYCRDMQGKVLALNYRTAPQFPWPCGLQDCIASYLWLIDPPHGAAHAPVNPKNIILAGDSAGGNLSLVMMEIFRDLKIPQPAGGVLISPWMDITTSFPSCEEMHDVDFLPYSGYIHRPSTLWPPPTAEMASHVQQGIRDRAVESSKASSPTQPTAQTSFFSPDIDLKPKYKNNQHQVYCKNSQLCHPYVSPIFSNLSGLPPCFYIAGDAEILRDETIYGAEKAVYPERFETREDSKQLLPSLREPNKFPPTEVHLQIWDATCHVLPMLYFSTPAMHMFRAIASFNKMVTSRGGALAQEIKLTEGIPKGQAGNYDVYEKGNTFIRERVAVDGKCRPMEPASEIPGLKFPVEDIANFKGDFGERYRKAQAHGDETFVSDSVSAGKERKKNLLEADAEWDLHRREIKDHLQKQKVSSDHFESPWRWAVEGEEPPPSAIVGRRDTEEARRLGLMLRL